MGKQSPAQKKGAAPEKNPAGSAAAAPPPVSTAATGNVDEKILAVGNQIRELKERLKSEGMSGKGINNDEGVKELVGALQELKKASSAAPAPAPVAAPAAAAPAGSGDVQADITAVGDQ